jgi:hypothetical protein
MSIQMHQQVSSISPSIRPWGLAGSGQWNSCQSNPSAREIRSIPIHPAQSSGSLKMHSTVEMDDMPPNRQISPGHLRLRLMYRLALVSLKSGLRHTPGVEFGFGIEPLTRAALAALRREPSYGTRKSRPLLPVCYYRR